MVSYRRTVRNGRSITSTVLGGIERALAVLNGDATQLAAAREPLKMLVTDWDNAKRNLEHMVKSHWNTYGRELKRKLPDALRLNIAWDRAATSVIDAPAILRAKLGHRLSNEDHQRLPLEAFALLVIDARWSRFGGPCDRCGRYYIKKRLDQKRYCGRRCAHLASAVRSTRKRLDAEKQEKLRRAIQAAKSWETTRTQLGWKDWVHQKEPDITPKFLTRAVNNGDLQAPVHYSLKETQSARSSAERK
jgi:hypothetical protein